MDKINELYNKFKTLTNISTIESNEDEAYLLSLTLADIEESVNEIIITLKEIYNSEDKEDIVEKLASIGEDLRHVIYHVKHSKYYGYLSEDDFLDMK